MRRIVVLRPEPGASATVARATERGLDAVAVPLFEVEPLAWTPPATDDFDALLLTSANSLRHAGAGLDELRRLPVYAVGAATADAARDAGFDVAEVGPGSARALLAGIDPDLKLLHLCGEHRTALDARQAIEAIPVYRAVERAGIDSADFAGAVVLIHSPRAGRRFAELAGQSGLDRRSIAIVAISRAAAEAAEGGWQSVDSAGSPADDALLALAARLCNTSNPT